MTTASPSKNARRKRARAATRPEPADGHALFQDLVGRIRGDRVGTVKKHPDGQYARVVHEGRTIGYLVPRRSEARVYAQALAAAMPAGLSFEKVKLGSHHFGRGEVVVAVAEPGDFPDAVKALRAAAKHPVPRKVAAKR